MLSTRYRRHLAWHSRSYGLNIWQLGTCMLPGSAKRCVLRSREQGAPDTPQRASTLGCAPTEEWLTEESSCRPRLPRIDNCSMYRSPSVVPRTTESVPSCDSKAEDEKCAFLCLANWRSALNTSRKAAGLHLQCMELHH